MVGLNNEFDQTRVQVLGTTPFTSIEQAFALVQQEESTRNVMLYSPPIEKTSLTINTTLEQSKVPNYDKDHLHYDNCGKPWYTIETCWNLHGRPSRGRLGK